MRAYNKVLCNNPFHYATLLPNPHRKKKEFSTLAISLEVRLTYKFAVKFQLVS
jgi:hypothetical protein